MHFRRPIPWSAPIGHAASALAVLVVSLPAAAQQCASSYVGGDLTGASANGGLAPSLSADGRRVAYLQNTFLYHAFLYDRGSGAKVQVDTLADGTPMNGAVGEIALSADGLHAALLSSAQNTGAFGLQIYVKDLAGGALHFVTVTPNGTPMTPTGTAIAMGPAAITALGDKVVFTSDSSELVPGKTTFWRDVFVRDLAAGTTVRLLGLEGAEPDLPALFEPALSSNGRYVAFASRARNLVAGDTNQRDDVFVHDLLSGATERVSMAWNGAQANHDSADPTISADGRYVAFRSAASNLVAGDTNAVPDMFVFDRATSLIQRVNYGPGGVQADATSLGIPMISAGGQRVLFHSVATNLVSTPVVGGHVYVRDLESHTTSLVVDPAAGSVENDAAAISADGQIVAFASTMPFGPGDTNVFLDVFLNACIPAAPASFCPATAASSGCVESIQWTGVPSTSAGSGFVLSTQGSTGHHTGLLVYSASGGNALPFSGSFLCLLPPVNRSGALDSGGSAPLDCSGSFSLDFNAWIAAGSDPALVEGAVVWAQFWSRDLGAASFVHLSNAVTFSIGP